MAAAAEAIIVQGNHVAKVGAEQLAELEISFQSPLFIRPSVENVREDEEMKQRRILAEVNHLRRHRLADRTIPGEVEEGVFDNLVTKVQEDSMSSAVTPSFQPVGEYTNDAGERRRTFLWRGIGTTALELAESGKKFYRLKAALERVDVEIEEARHSEDNLCPGTYQVFISPRMSRQDASFEDADAIGLAEYDSVRTGAAVVEDGVLTGRRTRALFVKDIPLTAWVAMMRDPNNVFGRAIKVEDAESALGIMRLFDQLDTSEDQLPEGPVTLVEAVLQYIDDPIAKQSVAEQLADFRKGQDKLQAEAKRLATKWLEFEKSMADSLDAREMTFMVRQFITTHQSQWPVEVLAQLRSHQKGSGYTIDEKLAAVIEESWQKINLSEAAIVVGDRRALKGMASNEVVKLQQEIAFIRTMEHQPWAVAELQQRQAALHRMLAVAEIEIKGSCSGTNTSSFKNSLSHITNTLKQLTNLPDAYLGEQADEDNSDRIGKKHMAKCRTDGCPTRPGQTEVGGCDVCLKYCQPIYDAGKDPAIKFGFNIKQTKEEPKQSKNIFKVPALAVANTVKKKPVKE